MTKNGPRLAIFGEPPCTVAPPPGAIHVHTAGALARLPSNILIRAPRAATSLNLLAQAQSASRRRDIDARVITAQGTERTGSVWSENRTWDPGD